MATKFCPSCGAEFLATVENCPDCDVALVDEAPPEIAVDSDSPEGQIEYALHEWSAESRAMVDRILLAESIPFVWEAADLVVPAVYEARVDAVLAQVEVTTLPTLDPDAPKIAYDIEDWSDKRQRRLMRALDDRDVAYEFDIEGALVVLEDDEDQVETILDELESPAASDDGDADDGDADDGDADDGDADDGDADDGDSVDDEVDQDDADEFGDEEDYDGPDAIDVLSDLFVAADQLMHSATDPDGVLSLVERGDDIVLLPLPYGYEPAVWRDILAKVGALRDLIESDDTDDEAIEAQARIVRDLLHNYV